MTTPILAPIDQDLLQRLTNGPTVLQQMWLSGYLYALASQSEVAVLTQPLQQAQAPSELPDQPVITVLYGSQTGNSKKAAQKAVASLQAQGWKTNLADLNDYPTRQLKSEKRILLVVSTQGEGEPPASAEEFYQWLMSNRAPKLEGLEFAVCALGDKSYLKFCQTGKDFDARLEALGARRLSARVDCDVDFEASVEAWIQQLLKDMPAPASGAAKAVAVQHVGAAKSNGHHQEKHHQYDRKNPFQAALLAKTPLNGRGSNKETWHLEFSLEGSGLSYQPGDALGIYPQNPPALVKEVLYAAMLNGHKTVSYNGREMPFRQVLLKEVELSVLTKELLEKYAAWTNNTRIKAILADQAALKTFLYGRNVADLLREFPAALSEETLLQFLRKMPPRLYSIASSPEVYPDEVHLTVAAVRYLFNDRAHAGAASTFLADRVEADDKAPVFVEQNEYFKLPENDQTDIIMVGPGTGVAPFRAFVQSRAERGGSGKNWLFFGNPHFETDFLYQTEWLQHLKQGTLDRLDVAFSRDQKEKIYVQHRLLERSKLIFERLENGAHFYVCGDKNHMAADVQDAVRQIIEKESGKDAEYAEAYVKNLKKQRRYLEDVY
ncbi:MAG TPA: assimilatory sulfite reductase (NADPH) flavoprotein subunit [Saprospiraceae bacterium]|nr:assimilatory sulfite reductase (NADPH) flavoprotein subunit [Saprospiraceae bacterium]